MFNTHAVRRAAITEKRKALQHVKTFPGYGNNNLTAYQLTKANTKGYGTTSVMCSFLFVYAHCMCTAFWDGSKAVFRVTGKTYAYYEHTDRKSLTDRTCKY